IRKCSDDLDTGRWQVFTCPTNKFQDGDKRAGISALEEDLENCQVDIFDFVLVCAGYFKIPKYPDIPGLDTFKGRTSHSFHYKGNIQTTNKTVLIIGNSFSAGDIASDVAANAKQVYLSVGDGTWMIPLISSSSQLFDNCLTRQFQNSSIEDQNSFFITECQKRLDHVTSGICPDSPPSQSPFMLSDDIHVKILSGQVKVIGRVTKVNGSTIYFNDKHKIVDVDEIIHCTGYDSDLSFIDLNIVQADGRMELFKMMFPVHETRHTLGLIGHFASDSAYGPIVELQSRYAVQIFTGKLTLPDKETVMADINMYNDICLKRRGKYYYMLPSLVFRDSIAKLLGVYPSFWSLLLKDPYLANQSWYGPSYSAQYRLLGPGSDWTKARETCYTAGREGMTSLLHGEQDASFVHMSQSIELQELSTYIVRVYGPVWFDIKTKPSCKDDDRHLRKTIFLSRYLSPALRKIDDPDLL
ncbi:Cyclopentanone 1,2-monooxygenase (CPMO), partial [Bulinus truncatus]